MQNLKTLKSKDKNKFQSLKDILLSKNFIEQREKSAKYINHEFQDFGYRLALQLNDMGHKSLYIKLAKTEKRELLINALSFAKDYPKANNKGKIFMWKLKELRAETKKLQKEEQPSLF